MTSRWSWTVLYYTLFRCVLCWDFRKGPKPAQKIGWIQLLLMAVPRSDSTLHQAVAPSGLLCCCFQLELQVSSSFYCLHIGKVTGVIASHGPHSHTRPGHGSKWTWLCNSTEDIELAWHSHMRLEIWVLLLPKWRSCSSKWTSWHNTRLKNIYTHTHIFAFTH